MSKFVTFLIILFCFLLGLFGIFYFLKSSTTQPTEVKTQSLITPSPISAKPQEVHSLDGKMNLTMTADDNGNGTTTYSFSKEELENGSPVVLFEKTVDAGITMSIPANSWSPENDYLFIVEETGGVKDYLVLQTSGEAFGSGEKALSVVPFFEKYKDKYEIADITGWDAPTLLHVKTKTLDGQPGQLFWFEVPTSAFMPLFRKS